MLGTGGSARGRSARGRGKGSKRARAGGTGPGGWAPAYACGTQRRPLGVKGQRQPCPSLVELPTRPQARAEALAGAPGSAGGTSRVHVGGERFRQVCVHGACAPRWSCRTHLQLYVCTCDVGFVFYGMVRRTTTAAPSSGWFASCCGCPPGLLWCWSTCSRGSRRGAGGRWAGGRWVRVIPGRAAGGQQAPKYRTVRRGALQKRRKQRLQVV